MTSDPLDQRLRQLMGEIASLAPEPPNLAEPRTQKDPPTSAQKSRVPALAVAAFVLVLIFGGALALSARDSDVLVATGETDIDSATSASAGAALFVDADGEPLLTMGAEQPTGMAPWVQQTQDQLLSITELGETAEEREALLADGGLIVRVGIDTDLQARTVQAFATLPEELDAVAVTVDNATGVVVSAVSRTGSSLGAAQPAGSARIAIYGAALDSGFGLDTIVDGSGPCAGERDGGPAFVENYGGSPGSEATVVDQAARASRCAELRLENALGRAPAELLEAMTGADIAGFVTDGPELTATEHVGAVVAAATDGWLPELSYIAEIVDAEGEIIYRPDPGAQVMSPTAALALMDVMVVNVERGTGTQASLTTTQAAGFTGTDIEFEAAWFVGTSNGRSTAVWLALPDGSPMLAISGRNVTGGSFPAQVWAQIHETSSAQPPIALEPALIEPTLCSDGYSEVDSNADGITDRCAPEDSEPPTSPNATGQSPCPADFPFGADTNGDGIVDTCYAHAGSAETATSTERELAESGVPVAPGTVEEPFFYTVQEGDRLAEIAEKYNVTVEAIFGANPDMDPDVIISGQLLLIPGAGSEQLCPEDFPVPRDTNDDGFIDTCFPHTARGDGLVVEEAKSFEVAAQGWFGDPEGNFDEIMRRVEMEMVSCMADAGYPQWNPNTAHTADPLLPVIVHSSDGVLGYQERYFGTFAVDPSPTDPALAAALATALLGDGDPAARIDLADGQSLDFGGCQGHGYRAVLDESELASFLGVESLLVDLGNSYRIAALAETTKLAEWQDCMKANGLSLSSPFAVRGLLERTATESYVANADADCRESTDLANSYAAGMAAATDDFSAIDRSLDDRIEEAAVLTAEVLNRLTDS